MKKIITGLVLMFVTTFAHATAYSCTGYSDGNPVSTPIIVNASKVIVAETKAYQRLKKAGLKVDIVRCQ